MIVVALLAIVAGAVMIRAGFARNPDPRDIISQAIGGPSYTVGPGGFPAPSTTPGPTGAGGTRPE